MSQYNPSNDSFWQSVETSLDGYGNAINKLLQKLHDSKPLDLSDLEPVEILGHLREQVRMVRMDIMTATKLEGLPPRSEQDWLSAMAHLELAAVELQRCSYHLMNGQ